jgi:hypothetical protein
LQSASIHHGGGWLRLLSRSQPQDGAQIVRHGFKASCLHPTACLLMNGKPRRQVMRQHPPGAANSHDVAQAVEEFAQGMIKLQRILFNLSKKLNIK